MRIALHIFAKDLRRLWPVIAVFLCYLAVQTAIDVTKPNPNAQYWRWPGVLAPYICAYLLLRVMQEDRLTGDRQFWLTRPYGWSRLLLGKSVFVVTTVCLPVLCVHWLVYTIHGYGPWMALQGAALRQGLLLAWALGPLLVLASISRGIGEFALAAYTLGVLALLAVQLPLTVLRRFDGQAPPGGLSVAAPAFFGVMVWLLVRQFRDRRTASTYAAFGIAVLLLVAFGWMVSAIPARPTPASVPDSEAQLLIGLPSQPVTAAVTYGGEWQVTFGIPIRVAPVSPGRRIERRFWRAQILGPGGSWISDQIAITGDAAIPVPHVLTMPGARYTALSSAPVTLRVTEEFDVLDRRLTPLADQGKPTPVPEFGHCALLHLQDATSRFECYGPSVCRGDITLLARRGEDLKWVAGARVLMPRTDSAFSAWETTSIFLWRGNIPARDLVVETEVHTTSISRKAEFRNVQLPKLTE